LFLIGNPSKEMKKEGIKRPYVKGRNLNGKKIHIIFVT